MAKEQFMFGKVTNTTVEFMKLILVHFAPDLANMLHCPLGKGQGIGSAQSGLEEFHCKKKV